MYNIMTFNTLRLILSQGFFPHLTFRTLATSFKLIEEENIMEVLLPHKSNADVVEKIRWRSKSAIIQLSGTSAGAHTHTQKHTHKQEREKERERAREEERLVK